MQVRSSVIDKNAILVYGGALALRDLTKMLDTIKTKEATQLKQCLEKALELFHLFKMYPNIMQAFSNDAMQTFLKETKNITKKATDFIGDSRVNICMIPFDSILNSFQLLYTCYRDFFVTAHQNPDYTKLLNDVHYGIIQGLFETQCVLQSHHFNQCREIDSWLGRAVEELAW
ncbi:hypothetical protein D4R87_03505 [bacterium]|nr:MAG: hypothetical protein D4R87_03505 [bacterium]